VIARSQPTIGRAGLFGAAPALTLALFLLPVLAGLVGTLLPAFGHLRALGGNEFSLVPWRELFAQPGVLASIRLSAQIGVSATLLSLGITLGLCAQVSDSAAFRRLSAWASPLLAAPHVALAVGFAFMAAPSGWIVRLLSPWLTGWERPPIGWVTVRDAEGVAMVLGLLLKEVPYLMLMLVAALNQVPQQQLRASMAALGYRGATAWLKCVLPLVYPQMRLPIFAVLAFSASNVEVALLLAPGNPPPLAVLAARWFSDYDLQRYYAAAAAAILQLGLVLLLLVGGWLGEGAVAMVGRAWCERGQRGGWAELVVPAGAALAALCFASGMLSLLLMMLWSFADSWRYPAVLPDSLSLATWSSQVPMLGVALLNTLSLALCSAGAALLLAIACLESETRRSAAPGAGALWLAYVPLLVPQIAFLYGFQVALVQLGIDGSWLAVAWSHLVFVLPYVFLSLADPWRALDARYARSAASLGATPWATLLRVRVPLLLRPIGVAFAVGAAVSVGLYLPTVFAGAGRMATLTTEAVTLSSGADRRILGVYAFAQALFPWLMYLAALLLPAIVYRQRKGMA
jgi:putative thiamine transport system permease protein